MATAFAVAKRRCGRHEDNELEWLRCEAHQRLAQLFSELEGLVLRRQRDRAPQSCSGSDNPKLSSGPVRRSSLIAISGRLSAVARRSRASSSEEVRRVGRALERRDSLEKVENVVDDHAEPPRLIGFDKLQR